MLQFAHCRRPGSDPFVRRTDQVRRKICLRTKDWASGGWTGLVGSPSVGRGCLGELFRLILAARSQMTTRKTRRDFAGIFDGKSGGPLPPGGHIARNYWRALFRLSLDIAAMSFSPRNRVKPCAVAWRRAGSCLSRDPFILADKRLAVRHVELPVCLGSQFVECRWGAFCAGCRTLQPEINVRPRRRGSRLRPRARNPCRRPHAGVW